MLLEYVAKFLVGGVFVCLFALIAQVCQPKQFAGIFSSAPSVLLAGLAITLPAQGATHATLTAEGAIAGAAGMICYCIVLSPVMKRHRALIGSILSLSIWLAGSFCAFVLLSIIWHW